MNRENLSKKKKVMDKLFGTASQLNQQRFIWLAWLHKAFNWFSGMLQTFAILKSTKRIQNEKKRHRLPFATMVCRNSKGRPLFRQKWNSLSCMFLKQKIFRSTSDEAKPNFQKFGGFWVTSSSSSQPIASNWRRSKYNAPSFCWRQQEREKGGWREKLTSNWVS